MSWVHGLYTSLAVLTSALSLLCEYGLVEIDATSEDGTGCGSYSVYACVNLWSILVVKKQWSDTLAEFTTCATARQAPPDNAAESWSYSNDCYNVQNNACNTCPRCRPPRRR
jgi:hypothetical protein